VTTVLPIIFEEAIRTKGRDLNMQEHSQFTDPTQPVKRGPHRFKPGQSGNPAGRSKGLLSPNDSIRRFANMPPQKLRALQAQVKRAMQGKCDFPPCIRHALDLQMFIAFIASLSPDKWKDATFIAERIEPSKKLLEVDQNIRTPDKIIFEIVDKRPTSKKPNDNGTDHSDSSGTGRVP
jgi:hypothetical protein